MKGQGLPPIKPLFIIIIILLAIIGLFTIINFIFPQQVDIAPITESQTQITDKINELVPEINSIKNDINQLKTTTASKSDIGDLNSRLDNLNNEMANIEPQAVQDINIFNTSTWINNYNTRMIFNISISLVLSIAFYLFIGGLLKILIKIPEFILKMNRKKNKKLNKNNEEIQQKN